MEPVMQVLAARLVFLLLVTTATLVRLTVVAEVFAQM